jgi:ZipA, C-terminal FtsZ-binding domain
MTSLQLGLIAGGVALVVGVVIYNWLQERRIRRRIDAAFGNPRPGRPSTEDALASDGRTQGRVEPSFAPDDARPAMRRSVAAGANHENRPVGGDDAADEAWEAPVDVISRTPVDVAGETVPHALADGSAASSLGARQPAGATGSSLPDPDIECIVTLQPVRPVPAGAVGAGMHARLGKPLRWFGRRGAGLPWQLLKADSVGEFSELAACMLLADRAGPASALQIEAFIALAGQIAPSLPAAFAAPEPAREADRAEALDRICGDLDVQIGLTLLKSGPAGIPGTRLRGVAEAAGFRLTDAGRFDCAQEENGNVLYSMQNFDAEPFSADILRAATTPGVVMLLDVPRVTDPARVFDQMKLAARRIAQNLDATLVDDNRRVLDDAALAAIRQQVHTAAAALREVNIEPGSARALALFGG